MLHIKFNILFGRQKSKCDEPAIEKSKHDEPAIEKSKRDEPAVDNSCEDQDCLKPVDESFKKVTLCHLYFDEN
jgi:hypothetical protein